MAAFWQALLWNPLFLGLFLFTGAYFTLRSRFFVFRRPLTVLRATFGQMRRANTEGISPFQALSCSLAACMGTGNIVGVASALLLGGTGSIFWMVLSALLGMATSCAENILGLLHRRKDQTGEWTGGSIAYVEAAFGSRKIAFLFAFCCVAAALGMGNMAQVNAAVQTLCEQQPLPPFGYGLLFAALTAPVIFGGAKRITALTEKLIPPLCAVFLLACFAVLIRRRAALLPSVCLIFRQAFSLRSAGAGAFGFTLAQTVRIGVARGVFSNEAGLGSAPLIHASAATDSPFRQGLWGSIEVFLDTVLMGSVTALVFLCSGAAQNAETPAEMTVLAFSAVFGRFSGVFVSAALAVFAFATLIGWACYGEKGAVYCFGRRGVLPYRLLYLICIVSGACIKAETVWALADIFNALMALPNLTALLFLRGEIAAQMKTPRLPE